MTITLNDGVAEDLILFKLRHLQNVISDILKKWNIAYVDDFLIKSRNGELSDAEMDAITVHQLSKDVDDLRILLRSIRKEE